jgi:glycine betaine/proline transport system substrate-binding protein
MKLASRRKIALASSVLISAFAATVTLQSSAKAADCGTWGIAMHAWNGYTASAQVVTEVAKSQGCTINQSTLTEGSVTYDAMEAGTTDVIIEDWGGGRWQPWVDRGSIVDVGSNGNIGKIGMFVAPWMVKKYPGITDSKNLNKYASLFKTADSGGKGAWYEGPPGYTTIGEKMIKANKLNFKAIATGSEAALISTITKAEKNKKAALIYWWEPSTLFVKVPGLDKARVNFPKNDWSDAAKASGLTDYPASDLQKLATKKLMTSGSVFAKIVKNFKWTNADQNTVASYIEGGMTPAAAAQKWIKANPAKVKAWLA